jgi:predicted MFS family arabinose efflux permease
MSFLFNTNFVIFLVSVVILSIPMPMLIILGSLAGAHLAPDQNLATFPVSIQLLAGMFAVAPMSLLMGKRGRRQGFLLSAVFAIIGGLTAVYSLLAGEFWILCVAHAFLGIAVVSFGLFRFAAAEIVEPEKQAQAISVTLGIGLVAALLAPEVFRNFKDILEPVPLAGAYMALSAIAFIGMFPMWAVKFSTEIKPVITKLTKKRMSVWRRPKVLAAIICGVGSFAGMMLLMTPTPIAMVGCGFLDVQAGDVIRWHVVAMFAPSFFTGSLIKRFGVNWIVAIGGVLLAFSAIIALWGIDLSNFYISLILLGVGWNFGYIGASAMLNAELDASEKPLYQGVNDTAIALGAAMASFSSGVLISSFGWAIVATVLLIFAAITVIGSVFHGWSHKYRYQAETE